MSVITQRTTSGFPLSIGTGLAIERIFAPVEESLAETEVTQDPNLLTFDYYLINVSTLLRNIINSLPAVEALGIKHEHFLDTLVDEVNFLHGFFATNNLNVRFYYNDYKFFYKTYPDRIRKATTDKQLKLESIHNYCMGKLSNKLKEYDITLHRFSNKVTFEKKKALILSHVTVDLLSYTNYTDLVLLESHTGAVKTRRTWNTKYYKVPGKDMSFLPFMEYILFIFGDSSMIKPAPIAERNKLYDNLVAQRVNPMTSEFSFNILAKNFK